MDHILLDCVEARILWQFVFFLFEIAWVTPLIRGTLRVTWSFCGKKRKKLRGLSPCVFWSLWRERDKKLVASEDKLDQALKPMFLCNFLLWVRKYMDERSMLMINFIDWFGTKGGVAFVFVAHFFLASPLGVLLIGPSYFGVLFVSSG